MYTRLILYTVTVIVYIDIDIAWIATARAESGYTILCLALCAQVGRIGIYMYRYTYRDIDYYSYMYIL